MAPFIGLVTGAPPGELPLLRTAPSVLTHGARHGARTFTPVPLVGLTLLALAFAACNSTPPTVGLGETPVHPTPTPTPTVTSTPTPIPTPPQRTSALPLPGGPTASPVESPPGTVRRIVAVTGRWNHTCVLFEDGAQHCWGGTETDLSYTRPAPVDERFVTIRNTCQAHTICLLPQHASPHVAVT